MTLQTYLTTLNKRFKSGIAKEHAYRADLEGLIRELVPAVEVTNEPANVTECGNPDFVVTRQGIPVGYIEAKDVGKDLNAKAYREQFARYRRALDNLIITDYVWFQFFQGGEPVYEVRLGELAGGGIKALPEHFAAFADMLREFCTFGGQTIISPKKLAEMMAAKARLLQTILEAALTSDESGPAGGGPTGANTALQEQYQTFKKILIHDLTPAAFADIYAQTLAYGMFAARLHDTSLDTFSREEAARLVPQSNPFLRKLFQHVAGYDIDERIRPTVDNLAEVFRATDVEGLLTNFGSSTQQNDPIVHFYETFLAEYDPALRKARGVWYTPEPVVNFIVRAVDDLLKTEFGLPLGLADTGKTTVTLQTQDADRRTKSGYREVTREVHKVQILDPATGTGTFLAEIVRHIYRGAFAGMAGAWPGYVAQDLLPRLHGFELLMASYAMAHLKLELLLRETGVTLPAGQRLQIYLTNSLEEHHPDTGTLFASWLSQEASEANRIKRDTPVMVVLGNPPYAVSSSNASIGPDGKKTWIGALLDDYKRDLNERKINLDDDYIKFIRYGHYLIERTGEGILAYISNNSFIDGITHRQMRKHLLESFDKIYILDLHGNAKKKETDPNGDKDENVFDIMQGVSINIFIKTSRSRELAQVYHLDLFGLRENKYHSLAENSMSSFSWRELARKTPYYFFVPKDFSAESSYKTGFSIGQLFLENNTGIQTKRDKLIYQFSRHEIETVIDFIRNTTDYEEIRKEYDLPPDGRDWSIEWAKLDIVNSSGQFVKIHYHPFDSRYTYFTGNSRGFMAYPRTPLSQNLLKENIALLAIRNSRRGNVNNYFVTKQLIDKDGISPFDNVKFFPLYLYPEADGQQSFLGTARKPNLNMDIVQEIARRLGLRFQPHPPAPSPSLGEGEKGEFTPLDLLDYIYAVLHSPTYRATYQEFLKIDFPRVPYPDDAATFWQLVALGGELRCLHLLESPRVNDFITTYPIAGDNRVTRRMTQGSPGFELTDKDQGLGQVWINDTQYFDGVPLVAWEFYIGGYQPAQKWLKDRHGRVLTFDDLRHYQQVIVALTETAWVMGEIDGVMSK